MSKNVPKKSFQGETINTGERKGRHQVSNWNLFRRVKNEKEEDEKGKQGNGR